jgi:uncharacterized membrane protein
MKNKIKLMDVIVTINFFSAIGCLLLSGIVIRSGLIMEGYFLLIGAILNCILMYYINR